MKRIILCIIVVFWLAQNIKAQPVKTIREHLSIDTGWNFALGHAYDTALDFDNGTAAFSYFAKAGNGDGAAAPGFDDRAWRKLDLPHDWAVELPFDPKGTGTHGYRAIGRNFPQNSIGWYRKHLFVPQSDYGKAISIAFDGVFRNCIVWVNGHYLGTEPSGYNSFEYNIGQYLNYGGENVIAVRVDATMEEGWFYEGAGIYRHVWLNKSNLVHVAPHGTFITTDVDKDLAVIHAQVTLNNDDLKPHTIKILQQVLDKDGRTIGQQVSDNIVVQSFGQNTVSTKLSVQHPQLWTLESPCLHQLITKVIDNGEIIDTYKTSFGIRTIRFDAQNGFFLNGKRVEIKGTNNHQDHAGIGVAVPDQMWDYRIKVLKEMGSNAIRCSHNPPAPEFLDACDRLGMLVIDENRLMGVASTQINDLKRMIIRDRNHPCIISWSIGNEEWAMEGTVIGQRVAAFMQAAAKSTDSSRAITAAVSGGIGGGISNSIELLGYNYVATKNTDEQHKKLPGQFSWGTEEGSTVAARGIYFDDPDKHYLYAYDRKQNDFFLTLEQGWKHYAARPYLAGMFVWSGFDYRGEPVPFGWPSNTSLFGMVDLCGFPKDSYYYLRSWWSNRPMVHVLPHWNWPGKEGKPIDVWVYSNCDEVELLLNNKSLGKKRMEINGHLNWQVVYTPGKLKAIGYQKGKVVSTEVVATAGKPSAIQLSASKIMLNAPERDIAVVDIAALDGKGLSNPVADNELSFKIDGPAQIIGVGNGNPTSLEADQFHETIKIMAISSLKEKIAGNTYADQEVQETFSDTNWPDAFKDVRDSDFAKKAGLVLYRGYFKLPDNFSGADVTFFYKCLGTQQSIFVNGKKIAADVANNNKGYKFKLDAAILHPGVNAIALVTKPLIRPNIWSGVNTDPGVIQLIYPVSPYKRKLFNGRAQVIIQTTGQAGKAKLEVTADGLTAGQVVFDVKNDSLPVKKDE